MENMDNHTKESIVIKNQIELQTLEKENKPVQKEKVMEIIGNYTKKRFNVTEKNVERKV